MVKSQVPPTEVGGLFKEYGFANRKLQGAEPAQKDRPVREVRKTTGRSTGNSEKD